MIGRCPPSSRNVHHLSYNLPGIDELPHIFLFTTPSPSIFFGAFFGKITAVYFGSFVLPLPFSHQSSFAFKLPLLYVTPEYLLLYEAKGNCFCIGFSMKRTETRTAAEGEEIEPMFG